MHSVNGSDGISELVVHAQNVTKQQWRKGMSYMGCSFSLSATPGTSSAGFE
jgi:hypothetical protein